MNSLLILDDHPIVADALSELVTDTLKDWRPVRADSLASAKELLRTQSISAAVVDLNLPDSSGPDTVRSLLAIAPDLKVFVYCGGNIDALRDEVMSLGALALVSKGANRVLLARTLSSALLAAAPISHFGGNATDLESLTLRQRDVLRRVVAGDRNSEISATLGVSLETVKTHLRALLRLTGCSNRTELARWASQNINR
jgi:two-component system, NarL family, response regulator, fimbrial Z protein, FimZ